MCFSNSLFVRVLKEGGKKNHLTDEMLKCTHTCDTPACSLFELKKPPPGCLRGKLHHKSLNHIDHSQLICSAQKIARRPAEEDCCYETAHSHPDSLQSIQEVVSLCSPETLKSHGARAANKS